MEEVTAILYMSDWSSRCSHCGGNADPDEDRHIHGGPGSMHRLGSDLGSTNGCGAVFVRKERDWM